MLDIISKQIAYNKSTRSSAIKYIVIHDTGNTGAGANALSHFNYFNGADRQSSADFFIDDSTIMQINDYTKYYSWHCGDGKGAYGITNANSVGIEICVNSDGDYNTAFENAVELTKYLMDKLGIDIDHVVRHYDASRKGCPNSMSSSNWALWDTFKNKLQAESEEIDVSKAEELEAKIEELETKVNVEPYNYTLEVPEWGRPTVQKLLDKGVLQGDDEGKLGITDEMLRILVINDRAGLY